jgi:hypothetical protein
MLLHRALPALGALASLSFASHPARAQQPTASPFVQAGDALTPPRAGATPPSPVSPAEPPPGAAHVGRGAVRPGYSSYESATIDRVLARLRAPLDPSPEGKIVESIDVVPLEVFEDRDPAPGFLNWFHVTSRPYIIRREVLLFPGRAFTQALADESARNLRSLSPLSLVLVFAVQGSRPDRVRVAVVTKDVWSLRLNSNYRFAGGQLEYLFLQPSERNLFGIHHAVAAQMSLDPGSISLGGSYSLPRIGGSRVRLNTDASAILNRQSGRPEGSFGSFIYGQPLYATQAEWAWGTYFVWRNEVTRRFVGAKLAGFDARATPGKDGIPYLFRSDFLAGSYIVTRSFGGSNAVPSSGTIKHDLSLGVAADRRVFRTDDLSRFDPVAASEFVRRAVPMSDTRIGPTFEYHTYSTRFRRLLDVNTLALQEDYLVGHDLSIKLYPVTTALNSSRDFMGISASAAYTVPLGDGLARAVVESVTEIERTRLADASLFIRARVHTPSFGFGRLVFDVRFLDRYNNYLNRMSELGGDTRLRGYPTKAFIGSNVFSANLELRTRPMEIWSCQLAGATFVDVGDAFDSADELRLKQSAGFGIRFLLPQLDRVVMRADWGLPLTRGYKEPDSFPGDIIFTFQQAFPMPSPLADP